MLEVLGTEVLVGFLAMAAFLAMAFWSSYGRRQGHPPRWPGGVSMSAAGEVSVLLFTATMTMAAWFPAWQVALAPLLLIAVVLGLYAQIRDARKHRQWLADLRELNAVKYPEAFDETRLRFVPGEILTGTTVRLFDNRTGRLLGEVPGELLRPLVRYLEKSRSPDYWGVLRDDAYLVEEELEILRAEGVAPELLAVLQRRMASSHDLELRWALKPTSSPESVGSGTPPMGERSETVFQTREPAAAETLSQSLSKLVEVEVIHAESEVVECRRQFAGLEAPRELRSQVTQEDHSILDWARSSPVLSKERKAC